MANPAKVFFDNPFYDGQFVRSVSAAYTASADLGEVFATARGIHSLSGDAWYESWSRIARVAQDDGQQALAVGDKVSAREAFLRASEYYRQAYYFIRSDLEDKRLQEAYHQHVDTFVAASALMEMPVSRVRIPYDDTTISAYFFAPANDSIARTTLLFPCGYDSTAEAGWTNVPAALERGYNALVFEGPGQGEMLFTQRRFFRPDFEHVLTQVVDWVVTRPEVDATRLALVGRSFGGYLAPRAATAEHRLAALVCDPAQPDMGAHLPSGLLARIAGPLATAQTRFSSERAEFFGARMASHGLDSISDYLTELRKFTMLDRASTITCPTLIVESENDFAGGGGQTLYDALTCPKQLVHLTAAQGADGHCAGLGQQVWNQAVYGWLVAQLEPQRLYAVQD